MEKVELINNILASVLLGGLSLVTITWCLIGVQTFIHDRKREKRDADYHRERMKEFCK